MPQVLKQSMSLSLIVQCSSLIIILEDLAFLTILYMITEMMIMDECLKLVLKQIIEAITFSD